MHYPIIDPVIVSLGPIAIRWYGLSYLAAFLMAWWLARLRARSSGRWSDQDVSDVVFYGAVGAVLGGRVGYVLFYGFEKFLDDPLWLLRIWDGGMSFHGGLLGGLVALALFARQRQRSVVSVYDFVAPVVPIGLGFGRLGNFANTELPGKPTDSVLGMIYPCSADAIQALNKFCTGQWESFARHPSPLYQAFAEGVVLFVVVWWFSSRPRPPGAVTGVFLIGYGALRFVTGMFREPDAHIGPVAAGLSMGQLLSLPMVAFGILLVIWSRMRIDTR